MPDFRSVMTNVINTLGNSNVTIVNYTAGTYNAYGDTTYTTGTLSITAAVQVLGQEDDLVAEGHFRSGDVIFYLDSNNGGSVTRGDRITYNSNNYYVKDIISYDLSSNIQAYEIRTSKKS